MKSETGTIGFIGGGEFPVIQRYEAGFVAGAKRVRPDLDIDIVYLSEFVEAFGDPAISNVGRDRYVPEWCRCDLCSIGTVPVWKHRGV